MEAATASPGSPEPSSRRGVRKRRLRTTPDSGESRVASGVAERVLRARRDEAGRINKSKTATCLQKPTNAHCRRGRPAGCPSKKTPVKNNTVKKSATKKESKRTPGPKLSKSNKQKAPNKSRGTPRKCNKDANMDTLSCGEEAAALKQSNDNNTDMAPKKDPDDHKTEKQKQWTLLKEQEESQNEENSIKKEESTENTEQLENALEHSTEAAKKPDGQPKADKAPRQPKRRKKPPLQYVRCEIEGCGTVLAHPRYLQHHIKYQHQLKKEYVCDHPSCGRLFRLQKQLLRHAKHHTDQRDYICEFCARAFKSAHNLAVHRMIHTGEKPIQCEICGFTCRQKASLNWHMKKHDAEASYQFSCPICGKKFEKKDCVVAHKAKSHPEVLIAEALASNAASVKNSHASVSEKVADTVSAAASTDQSSSVGQENQEAAGGTLTQLQQVVLPLASQINTPQGQFFQLQTCHAVQVVHEQTPTLVHLTPVHLPQISSNSHPQVLQGSTLLSLGHVASLVPAAPLEPQATQWDGTLVAQPPRDRELWEGVSDHQWVREADGQMTTENELWEEVVVGGGHQDVREMENMWDANGERRKEDEGNVWDREDG